ncbi:MAG: sigma-70 family RNA polymerase sigma factor [Phycisphaerales bacterium]|nr:MAG: sigma-70 family RNA polymerase sigma factor [Phycisphaerales bacterium]
MTDDGRRKSGIAALVRASQAGDKVAFDRLVRLHQQQAMRLATGMLGDVDDAAEAVQEALVKAYTRLGSLKIPGRFRVWLLRIVAHEAISRQRARRRQAGFLRLAAGYVGKRTVRTPDAAGQTEDLKTAIKRAMAQLTAKEAQAITLFGLEDLPHEEVARIMGCSTQSTRWHVYRARQKLRLLLREHLK